MLSPERPPMAGRAVTLTVTVSVSVSVPSDVRTVIVCEPVVVAVYRRLASVALTSATLPEIWMELVPPPVMVALPVVVKVPAPFGTETVVVTVALSSSPTEIPVIAFASPATADWEPGRVLTGASLTALTATVAAMDTLAASAPPLAVPPLSVMPVSVTTRLDVPGLSLVEE